MITRQRITDILILLRNCLHVQPMLFAKRLWNYVCDLVKCWQLGYWPNCTLITLDIIFFINSSWPSHLLSFSLWPWSSFGEPEAGRRVSGCLCPQPSLSSVVLRFTSSVNILFGLFASTMMSVQRILRKILRHSLKLHGYLPSKFSPLSGLQQ